MDCPRDISWVNPFPKPFLCGPSPLIIPARSKILKFSAKTSVSVRETVHRHDEQVRLNQEPRVGGSLSLNPPAEYG
jgi:hypothetical protein